MKKVYIIPTIAFVSYQVEGIMQETISGNYGSSESIGYGGSDGDGSGDPDAKSFSVWDEE